MKQPEEYIWPWCCRGFQGLFGMLQHYLDDGLPVTDYLVKQLRNVSVTVNTLLEKAENAQRQATGKPPGEAR